MKKAEEFGYVFTFLIILMIVGIVALFGYNAFMKLKERQCQAEMVSFKDDLKITIEELARRDGATKEKMYIFNCPVSKIYFIDRAYKIENQTINENPFVNNSIHSTAKDNMFIFKKHELFDQADMGDITLVPPYYGCFQPSGNQIEMILEGKDGKAVIQPKSARYSCGPTLVKAPSDQKVTDTLQIVATNPSAVDFFESNNQQQIKEKYENTKDYIDITREFKTTETGTKVIIRINPKPGIALDQFKYIEELSKECMQRLYGSTYLNTGDLSGVNPPANEIILDPLIMWHLGNTHIQNESQITYTINDPRFEELCRELLSGMGWSEGVNATTGP